MKLNTAFYILILLVLISLICSESRAGEIANIDEPLKNQYDVLGGVTPYLSFFQTDEFADSYSMICDMGEAVIDPVKEGWYSNRPINGLKFELRAQAVFKSFDNKIKPIGFVVVTKFDDVLIQFKPLGEFKDGKWDGDVFNSWSVAVTDIEVFSEYFGKSGYAKFDLLDGKGFFFKSYPKDAPDYFLSNCKRIKKTGLPVYEWK